MAQSIHPFLNLSEIDNTIYEKEDPHMSNSPLKLATLAASMLLSGTVLMTGSAAFAQPIAPASAEEAPGIAIDVDANVVIEDEYVEFQGPVSDFAMTLPETSDASSFEASVADEGLTADLTLNYENPSKAVLETDVPENVNLEVVQNDEGTQSVMLTDTAGELVGGIVFEEAFAADGRALNIGLAVEGSTIVQTFTSSSATVIEPVTVQAAASTVWYKRGWVTKKSGGKYIVNVDPTKLGRQQIAWNTHATHVKHAKKVLGTTNTKKYWNWNIEQQFVCHVVGAWFPSGVYNMESWQPALAWGKIANPIDRCNRLKK